LGTEEQILHEILEKGKEGIGINYGWYPPYNDLEPIEKKYGVELDVYTVEDLLERYGKKIEEIEGDYIHMWEAGYRSAVYEVRDPVTGETKYVAVGHQWDTGGWGWSLGTYDTLEEAIKAFIGDIRSVIDEYEDYLPNVEDPDLYEDIESEIVTLEETIEVLKKQYKIKEKE